MFNNYLRNIQHPYLQIIVPFQSSLCLASISMRVGSHCGLYPQDFPQNLTFCLKSFFPTDTYRWLRMVTHLISNQLMPVFLKASYLSVHLFYSILIIFLLSLQRLSSAYDHDGISEVRFSHDLHSFLDWRSINIMTFN